VLGKFRDNAALALAADAVDTLATGLRDVASARDVDALMIAASEARPR
jgi:hypothetical protein